MARSTFLIKWRDDSASDIPGLANFDSSPCGCSHAFRGSLKLAAQGREQVARRARLLQGIKQGMPNDPLKRYERCQSNLVAKLSRVEQLGQNFVERLQRLYRQNPMLGGVHVRSRFERVAAGACRRQCLLRIGGRGERATSGAPDETYRSQTVDDTRFGRIDSIPDILTRIRG